MRGLLLLLKGGRGKAVGRRVHAAAVVVREECNTSRAKMTSARSVLMGRMAPALGWHRWCRGWTERSGGGWERGRRERGWGKRGQQQQLSAASFRRDKGQSYMCAAASRLPRVLVLVGGGHASAPSEQTESPRDQPPSPKSRAMGTDGPTFTLPRHDPRAMPLERGLGTCQIRLCQGEVTGGGGCVHWNRVQHACLPLAHIRALEHSTSLSRRLHRHHPPLSPRLTNTTPGD